MTPLLWLVLGVLLGIAGTLFAIVILGRIDLDPDEDVA